MAYPRLIQGSQVATTNMAEEADKWNAGSAAC